jgi:hypothetical protein
VRQPGQPGFDLDRFRLIQPESIKVSLFEQSLIHVIGGSAQRFPLKRSGSRP